MEKDTLKEDPNEAMEDTKVKERGSRGSGIIIPCPQETGIKEFVTIVEKLVTNGGSAQNHHGSNGCRQKE